MKKRLFVWCFVFLSLSLYAENTSPLSTYNEKKQLTQISYPDGFCTKFVYDAKGNRIQMNDRIGTTHYQYDSNNRLVQITFPQGHIISYSYNDLNQITKIIYPNHKMVTYTYDKNGQIENIADPVGKTTFVYDEKTFLLKEIKRPSGLITQYFYDNFSRIVDVIHEKSKTPLLHFHYENTPSSRSVHITENKGEQEIWRKYLFDSSGQLIGKMDSSGYYEKYLYNKKNHCIKKETPSQTIYYIYDENDRLVKAGDTLFSYNEMGNLIKKITKNGMTTFSYDCDNHLIHFESPETYVDFVYNGDGLLVGRKVDSIPTLYLKDFLSPIQDTLVKIQNDEPELMASIYEWILGAKDKEDMIYFTYARQRLGLFDNDQEFSFLYDNGQENLIGLIDQTENFVDFFVPSPKKPSTKLSFPKIEEPFDPQTHLVLDKNRYFDPEMFNFISPPPTKPIYILPERSKPFGKKHIIPVSNELFSRISDPTGMMINEEKKEILLFGQKNASLSCLSWEELHFLLSSNAIGVKTDLRNGNLFLSFAGGEQKTAFNHTILEAAYLLQSLQLGEDLFTKKPISGVADYRSLFDRYQEEGVSGAMVSELCLAPKAATLLLSNKENTLLIDHFDFCFQNTLSQSSLEFAIHFLDHYEEYANSYPVLEKLKILGKWVCLAGWLQKNQFSIDSSFQENEHESFFSSPPSLRSSSWFEHKMVSAQPKKSWYGKKKKKNKIQSEEHFFSLYSLTNVSFPLQNFNEKKGSEADDWEKVILNARPSIETNQWTFEGPNNEEYQVISLPIQ